MSMRRSRRMVSSGATPTAITPSATAVSTVLAVTTMSMPMSGMVVLQRGRDDPAVQEQPGADAHGGAEQPDQQPFGRLEAQDPPPWHAEGEEGGPLPGALVGVDARGVVGDEHGEHEDEQLEHLEDAGEVLQAVLHDLGGHRDGLHRGHAGEAEQLPLHVVGRGAGGRQQVGRVGHPRHAEGVELRCGRCRR